MGSKILERFFEEQHRHWKTKAHGLHGLYESACRTLRWRERHSPPVNPNPPGPVLPHPRNPAKHGGCSPPD